MSLSSTPLTQLDCRGGVGLYYRQIALSQLSGVDDDESRLEIN